MTHQHKPTKETKRLVETSSGLGLPHEQIGALIGIDDKTLRKHYREELDVGKAKASAKVAQTLFNKALSGDTTAMIWWSKAQMRWAEVQRHEMTGANGGAIQIDNDSSVFEAILQNLELQKQTKK